MGDKGPKETLSREELEAGWSSPNEAPGAEGDGQLADSPPGVLSSAPKQRGCVSFASQTSKMTVCTWKAISP